MSERETSLSFKPIGPTLTYALGAALSIFVGTVAGKIGAWFVIWLSGLSPHWAFMGFWPFFCGVGWLFFTSGDELGVPVGYVGVPTFIGRRMDHMLGFHKLWWGYSLILSEGKHWGIPGLSGKIDVNHKTQTSREIEVKDILSADSISMEASFSYQYQITRPYAFLDAQNEMLGLEQIGESKLRNAIAANQSQTLTLPDTDIRSNVSKKMEEAMISVSKDDYGIEIIKVNIIDIKLPADLTAALEKTRIAQANAEGEKVLIESLSARIKDLMTLGLSAESAKNIVMAERGNLNAELKTYHLDDLDKYAPIVIDLIKQVFGREKA